MPAALTTAPASIVLDRLYEAAKKDEIALDAFRSQAPDVNPHDLAPRDLADLAAEIYMPVSRETGTFLYQLVRATRPGLIVEFGTSFGISAIHLAAGAQDNGVGRVITTELSETKARTATVNLAKAGLDALVEVRVGDAHETLREERGPIDLLLLDGWNQLYLSILRILEPRLRPGSVIVADDVTLFPAETKEYLEYVRDPSHGYVSSMLPLDDGLEVSVRL
jgi:predicted O-methyltransferase YrrM